MTSNTQVLAFIGLGLILWGALLFFVRPISYVKSSLLAATAISTYTTIDRINNDLNLTGQGYYIPSLPQDIKIPEHLKILKETIVFISKNNDAKLPSMQDMLNSKFILENSNGITITPPGLGIVEQFEKELRVNLTNIDLEDLCDILTRIILENLQLAKEVVMGLNENHVHLKITDSVFKALYNETDLQCVHFLGSPLVSAIACAIVKTTGKLVTIQESKINPETDVIEVTYQIIEGK